MKQASMPDEACFMCQRSLLRWASKPISFFPYIFRKRLKKYALMSYVLHFYRMTYKTLSLQKNATQSHKC